MLKVMGSAYFCTETAFRVAERWERVVSGVVRGSPSQSESGSSRASPSPSTNRMVGTVCDLENSFVSYSHRSSGFLRGDAEDPALQARQRDIFPLPLVDAAVAAELQFSYDGVAEDESVRPIEAFWRCRPFAAC